VNIIIYISSKDNNGLTPPAPDRATHVGSAARFASIFLASGLYCFQAESRPTHQQVTQTVSTQSAHPWMSTFIKDKNPHIVEKALFYSSDVFVK
jgi:hypothetical protein